MKDFFENINRKYEAFQKSISKSKHIVGLILAIILLLVIGHFKETLEVIHPIVYSVLYVFSFTWSIFHLQGLLGSRKK